MSNVATYGWESLAPPEGGRRLIDHDERHQISAKVRTNGAYKGWLFIKIWSEQSGWSHLAVDPTHTIVAQGYGEKEKESYSDLRRILGHKGIGAARADLS
ncbi:MAG TPA: hypothetical protein VGN13_10735 [Solirubrobacteraceae bacterium]|jgi:hypothetical protein